MRSYYKLVRATKNVSFEIADAFHREETQPWSQRTLRYIRAGNKLMSITQRWDAEAKQRRSEDYARAKKEIMEAVERIASGTGRKS